jgi:hypothetical protein
VVALVPLAGASPSRKSQCGRILRVLSDGEWHTTREILNEVPAIIHSRVSELRKTWGLNVEHRTTGTGARGSEYRLVTLPTPGPAVWPGAGNATHTPVGVPQGESAAAFPSPGQRGEFDAGDGAPPALIPGQLNLEEVA